MTILRATDLNCPSCVAKIEKRLSALDGVNSAEVKFASGRIMVDHDDSVTSNELVAAVADAGYTASVSLY